MATPNSDASEIPDLSATTTESKVGQTVLSLRKNGAWSPGKIVGIEPDGTVIIDLGNGKMKELDADQFQSQVYIEGQTLLVLRSSGEYSEGRVETIEPDATVIISLGSSAEKRLSADQLQKQVLRESQGVMVLRSSGERTPAKIKALKSDGTVVLDLGAGRQKEIAAKEIHLHITPQERKMMQEPTPALPRAITSFSSPRRSDGYTESPTVFPADGSIRVSPQHSDGEAISITSLPSDESAQIPTAAVLPATQMPTATMLPAGGSFTVSPGRSDGEAIRVSAQHSDGCISAPSDGAGPVARVIHTSRPSIVKILSSRPSLTSARSITPTRRHVPLHEPKPSLTPSPRLSPGLHSLSFGIEEVNMGSSSRADPSLEPLKSQLLAKLCRNASTTVTPMGGFCGGMNEGLWWVENDTTQTLVLKLVRGKRTGAFTGLPSEVEKFVAVHKAFPSIATDAQLAFPVKMFNCIGPSGHLHDIIAMPMVEGERLSDWMAMKWYAGQKAPVFTAFEQLGVFLKRFHRDYNMFQHGDFQPSNIFYEEQSGRFALVDIADMALMSQHSESDGAHFVAALKIMSSGYGAEFFEVGKQRFEAAYANGI